MGDNCSRLFSGPAPDPLVIERRPPYARTLEKGPCRPAAALLLLAALPLGTLAAPAGETGCSLQRTVEQLGGGAAGQSQAPPSWRGPTPARTAPCTASSPPAAGLLRRPGGHLHRPDPHRRGEGRLPPGGVRIPELYGLTLTGEADGSGFTPDSASAAKEREIYTDLCAAIEALRYDRPGHPVDVGHRLRVPLAAAERRQVKTENMVFAFKLVYGGQEKSHVASSPWPRRKTGRPVDPEADLYTQVKTPTTCWPRATPTAATSPTARGRASPYGLQRPAVRRRLRPGV